MIGLGTIVNAAAVVAGALFGMVFHGGLRERFQNIVMKAIGLSVIFIGISGALEKMLVITADGIETAGTMEMIISMVLGGIIGEWIDIEKRMEQFGEFLKRKVKGKNDPLFVEGFVSASLIICIGAMAVVGSIQDGIYQDRSMLYAKAVLDFVIVMILASSYGKGVAFSALPLFVYQGLITLCASAIEPMLNDNMLTNLSIVGSVLIFAVGLNIGFGKQVKVGNLLPALIIAVLFGINY